MREGSNALRLLAFMAIWGIGSSWDEASLRLGQDCSDGDAQTLLSSIEGTLARRDPCLEERERR